MSIIVVTCHMTEAVWRFGSDFTRFRDCTSPSNCVELSERIFGKSLTDRRVVWIVLTKEIAVSKRATTADAVPSSAACSLIVSLDTVLLGHGIWPLVSPRTLHYVYVPS